jgi:hypothetical protein
MSVMAVDNANLCAMQAAAVVPNLAAPLHGLMPMHVVVASALGDQ